MNFMFVLILCLHEFYLYVRINFGTVGVDLKCCYLKY